MKTILTIILALNTIFSFAQNSKKQLSNSTEDNEPTIFKLFPTQNIWTFIKLNTRNGQLWQVQFDVKEGNRFTSILSIEKLVPKEMEANNRFTLYPTQNIYTFILLDQIDGKTWQVQWAIDSKDRIIIPID